MTAARRLLSLSAAAGVLAFAGPALAQDQDGDAQGYQYAQPAPPADSVVFHSDPVVQPVNAPPPPMAAPEPPMGPPPVAAAPPSPMPPAPPPPPGGWHHHGTETREVEYRYENVDAPPPPPAPVYAPMAYPGGPLMAAPGYPQPYAQPYPPAYAPPPPPQFDRGAWLDDCHERIRGVSERDRGGVIGGLLGAIAGGVVGNRVNDRHRLAGTLVGAGVGGIAGLVVGSAIDAAGHRRHDDECALYLDRYLAEYPPTGYGYPGGYPAAYGYGYPVAMMPVLIQVPQRTIIRETVTEETWTETRPGPAHRPARHHPRREGKYVREN